MMGSVRQSTSETDVSGRLRASRPSWRGEASLVATFTLVLWLSCLIVGLLGYALPYARPHPPAPPPTPVEVIHLNVELTRDPLPPSDASPPPLAMLPPPVVESLTPPPPSPPLIAVAEPNPVIAFALPVEGPSRIVPVDQASASEPAPSIQAPIAAPPVQRITYGEGDGRQPAPDYPRLAIREGQEGAVTIRFSVGENGRVLAAEASTRSPWPLLNEAALRVVRSRWRFPRGPFRLYEVSIRFELTQ